MRENDICSFSCEGLQAHRMSSDEMNVVCLSTNCVLRGSWEDRGVFTSWWLNSRFTYSDKTPNVIILQPLKSVWISLRWWMASRSTMTCAHPCPRPEDTMKPIWYGCWWALVTTHPLLPCSASSAALSSLLGSVWYCIRKQWIRSAANSSSYFKKIRLNVGRLVSLISLLFLLTSWNANIKV